MFQESELFNLLMAAIGLLVYRVSLKKLHFPGAACFRYGFLVMVLSFCFTIIEGVFWPRLFNLLEHMAYAAAGIVFSCGCWQLMNSRHKAKATKREIR